MDTMYAVLGCTLLSAPVNWYLPWLSVVVSDTLVPSGRYKTTVMPAIGVSPAFY